jgi:hypothetical protein
MDGDMISRTGSVEPTLSERLASALLRETTNDERIYDRKIEDRKMTKDLFFCPQFFCPLFLRPLVRTTLLFMNARSSFGRNEQEGKKIWGKKWIRLSASGITNRITIFCPRFSAFLSSRNLVLAADRAGSFAYFVVSNSSTVIRGIA